MRPDILNPLFAQVTSLPGIGPRMAKLVEKVAGPTVVRLLWHLPRDVVDRSFSPTIAEAPPGTIVTLRVTVERHMPGQGRRPYRVRCRPPCLMPMAALHRMIEDEMIADLVPTFGSVNMIGGELDR